MFTTGFPVRDKLDAQVGKWAPTMPVVGAGNVATPEPAPEEQPVVHAPAVLVSDTRAPALTHTAYRGLANRDLAPGVVMPTNALTERSSPNRPERREAVRVRSGRHR